MKTFLPSLYHNNKLLLLSLFSFSLIFSFLFLLTFKNMGPAGHMVPGTDYRTYYRPIAQDIFKQNGIPINTPEAIRYPIGYPAFLAVIFYVARLININTFDLIILVNVLLNAFSACLLFQIARRILEKPIALLSAILFSTYPLMLWFIKNPHTEVPFIFLFYISIWLYMLSLQNKSKRVLFGSGIFLGLASLIRPTILFLPIPLLIIWVISSIKQKHSQASLIAVFFILGFLVAIAPWISYVYLKTGRIIPLSTGGMPSIMSGFHSLIRTGEGGNSIALPSDVTALLYRTKYMINPTASEILHFMLEEIKTQPVAVFKFIIIKMTRAWYATTEMWWENIIAIVQIGYLFLAVVGLFFLYHKRYKKYLIEIITLLAIILYFWAMTTIVLSILRYMIPVMGIVLIFTAIGIYMLCTSVSLVLKRLRKNLKE